MAEAGGFSVLRRGQRHASLKGLPGPLYVSRRVVVSMQAGSAVRARVPADRQAFVYHNATTRAGLAGGGRRHGYDLLPGACCLESKDGKEHPPTSITDAFGEVMVLHHVGRLQIFVIDRVVLAHQLDRCLMLEILPLAFHRLMRLGQQSHRLTPPIAALLPTGYAALCRFELALGAAIAARVMDHRAIGQGGKRF
jgi:hypothetical protein